MLSVKKYIVYGLAGFFFFICMVAFFGSDTPDSSCEFEDTVECEEAEADQDAGFSVCCVSFIIMCAFIAWGNKIQQGENLQQNMQLAHQMQSAETERLTLERERMKLAEATRLKSMREAEAAEKARLRKEIEELERDLED